MTDPAGSHARSGRVTAVVLMAVAIAVAIAAANIEYAFASDPLGPKALPLLLAGSLAACSIWYFLQPGDAEPWPPRPTMMRAAGLIAATVVGVALMNVIGFIAAAALMCTVAAWLFGATPSVALLIGVAQAMFWYILFKIGLGTYLPAGTLLFPG